MRLIATLAGFFTVAGCVVAQPPQSVAVHTETVEARPDQSGGIERASYVAEEGGGTETVIVTSDAKPAWVRLSRKELQEIIKKQEKQIERLEKERAIAEEGFRYVTLDWIKAALFYRGYYQDISVPAGGVDDLVFSYLGGHTVRASQRFQCDFDRDDSRLCDPRSKTGWLTFIEARDLICRGAYEFTLPTTTRPKADPDLTLLVAEWYMKGRVYKKDERIAYFLLKHLLENITYRFENSSDNAERSRLADFQRRALEAMDMISATPGVSIKDIRDYAVGDVCPRKL